MEVTRHACSFVSAKPLFGALKNHGALPFTPAAVFSQKLESNVEQSIAGLKTFHQVERTVKCNSSLSDNDGGNGNLTKSVTGASVGEFGERVVMGEFQDDDDTGIRLECDESGCVLVIGKKANSLEEEITEGFLRCDINGKKKLILSFTLFPPLFLLKWIHLYKIGCYYSPEKVAQEFRVVEGAGWRLGYETSPENDESFCAMVLITYLISTSKHRIPFIVLESLI